MDSILLKKEDRKGRELETVREAGLVNCAYWIS
jgi:hypothetical protein